MPRFHAPGSRPARPPPALQTTTDESQQNNAGPLGGPVIVQPMLSGVYQSRLVSAGVVVISSRCHNDNESKSGSHF